MYKNGYHYTTKDLIIVKTQLLQKFENCQTSYLPTKDHIHVYIKMCQINKILLM